MRTIIVDGKETTKAKEMAKKATITRLKKSKRYNLFYLVKENVIMTIPNKEIVKLSSLLYKTIENKKYIKKRIFQRLLYRRNSVY